MSETAAFLEEVIKYADAHSLTRGFAPGAILFREGEDGTELFVIRKGSVAVLRGGVKIATVREPGAILGEMSTLLSQKRSATLRVEEASQIVGFTPEQFMELLEQFPKAGGILAKMLASRIVRDVKREEQEKQKLSDVISGHEKFMKTVYVLSRILKEKQPSEVADAYHDLLFSNAVARVGIPEHEIDARRLPSLFQSLLP